jgi:dynein heavy chain
MTAPMRFIFETDNLLNASPATVSRAGMIYIEPSMLGARTHFDSWL